MLSKEWLQGCKMMADAGVMFQSDAVKSLLDHIAELEENATAQALALKAAKAMQQAETERADANEQDAARWRYGAVNGFPSFFYAGQGIGKGYAKLWTMDKDYDLEFSSANEAIDDAIKNGLTAPPPPKATTREEYDKFVSDAKSELAWFDAKIGRK